MSGTVIRQDGAKDRMLTTVAQPCPLCGSGEWSEPAGYGRDFEFASSADVWRCKRCRRCDVVYLDPRPDDRELAGIYPPSYYAYTGHEERQQAVLQGKSLVNRLRVGSYLKQIRGLRGRILDIGCGEGEILGFCEALGVARERLVGIDFKDEAIQAMRARGYEAVQTSLEAYRVPAGAFALIIMNQIIEHVANPREVIRAYAAGLEPGGVLFLETPNTRSLDFHLFGKRSWGGYDFPRHWVLFNIRSIRRLFDGTDLEIVRIRTLPQPFFWIWSIRHWLEERRAPAAISRLVHWKNPALVALLTLWDLPWVPWRLTGNLQVIARKRRGPEHARG